MEFLNALRLAWPRLRQTHQITGQTELKLAGNLTEFPMEILDLADSLEFLNLSDNHLSHLPDEFSQLKHLKIVFFNNNQFEIFPEVLAQCPNLSMISFKGNQINRITDQALSPTIRWLILTNNQLEVLPQSIGRLARLQKLMLAGNQLRSLPPTLGHCHNLELVRLAANQLEEFPDFLLKLPRLSWLAFAGNPFCDTVAGTRAPQALPLVTWDNIELGEILGQGASGVIYKGQITTPIATAQGEVIPAGTVAVKLFKGNITSDGSPLDEMRACMAAGIQANLITAIAQITQTPDGQAGLVLPFFPNSYTTLGSPPSLDTCTRDIYPGHTTFSVATVLEIARGIAGAIAHLHQQGILHGDLYAHNILVNQQGTAMLGDFGAASFYNPLDTDRGSILEKLETRAFGCLLEDLLDRCQPVDATEHSTIARLRRLQDDCMQPMVGMRPQFSRICEILV